MRPKLATLALIAALVMAAAVTACTRVPVGEAGSPITFTIRAFESPSAPSSVGEVPPPSPLGGEGKAGTEEKP